MALEGMSRLPVNTPGELAAHNERDIVLRCAELVETADIPAVADGVVLDEATLRYVAALLTLYASEKRPAGLMH